MTCSTHSKTLDQTIAAIQALDLTPIKFKATCTEDGYGWSAEHADKMEVAYKRYLILLAKYPETTIAPNRDIDRFWHMHILDTRKYAADCEATFGEFVHHFPYLGLRGEEDAKVLQAAFVKMQALYAQEFGEPMPTLRNDAAFCARSVGQETAAFCAREAGQGDAAFCARSVSQETAAFCAREAGQGDAAFCARSVGQEAAAFCAREAGQGDAAFCARSVSQETAAFCAREAGQGDAAFCARSVGQEAAAFCARGTGQSEAEPEPAQVI